MTFQGYGIIPSGRLNRRLEGNKACMCIANLSLVFVRFWSDLVFIAFLCSGKHHHLNDQNK